MKDKVIFYNHYGNGDVHYSRDFVKDIMKKIPAKSYEYYHRHNIDLLKDIPELKSFNTVNSLSYDRQEQVYLGDTVAINTWIGQQGAKYLKYDCSMYSNYNMFVDIYNRLGIEIDKIDYYLPTINFDYVKKDGIDAFINGLKMNVLLSNGNVFSGQAYNFNFDYIIEKISNMFPDVNFILTHDSSIKNSNIYSATNIIGIKNNLNEIGYLSTFCDIIIGRASGPYCFAQLKDNFFDEGVTFISFSNKKSEGDYYGFLPEFDGELPLSKMVHSNKYDRTMVDIIKKEIESIQ